MSDDPEFILRPLNDPPEEWTREDNDAFLAGLTALCSVFNGIPPLVQYPALKSFVVTVLMNCSSKPGVALEDMIERLPIMLARAIARNADPKFNQ